MPAHPALTERMVRPLRASREAGLTDSVTLEWVAQTRNSRGRNEAGAVTTVATEPCLLVPSGDSAAAADATVGRVQPWTLVLRADSVIVAGMRGLVRYTRNEVAHQRLIDIRTLEAERPVEIIRRARAEDADLT